MDDITTILFDVGGPLVNDDPAIDAWHEHLRQLVLDRTGQEFSTADIGAIMEQSIACYAPSFISFVIWQMVRPNKNLFYELRRECDRFPFEKLVEPVPGVIDILKQLKGHFKLGIVANQNSAMGRTLEEMGILSFFDSKMMSEDLRLAKPDTRIFLAVLQSLGSRPEEAAMIGDRQDNDIVPAKSLKMTAVRLLVGPHRHQAVRYPREEPDHTIQNLSGLLDIPFISNKLNL
ncbi:putative Inorganic diphosphatase [Candidatus Zixiibacteriota bacterium]|nr:putative Inorganic diphosphatase [candidate division Zixibacteria bacterium]